MHIVVRILLLISFFIASESDIRTLLIPDWVHILILSAGLLHIATGGISFKYALFSMVIMTVAIIVLSLAQNPLGGGDCKMIIATTFVFGLYYSLQALTITFALFGLYCLLGMLTKKIKKGDAKPLAPFLFAGYILLIL